MKFLRCETMFDYRTKVKEQCDSACNYYAEIKVPAEMSLVGLEDLYLDVLLWGDKHLTSHWYIHPSFRASWRDKISIYLTSEEDAVLIKMFWYLTVFRSIPNS